MRLLSWAVMQSRQPGMGPASLWVTMVVIFTFSTCLDALKLIRGDLDALGWAFVFIDPVFMVMSGFVTGVKLHEWAKKRRSADA